MSLYIIDREIDEIAASYAAIDDDSVVFLIQDGVYLSPELFKNKEVYVLNDEVCERGLESVIPGDYKKVDYADIIDLILKHNVISFC